MDTSQEQEQDFGVLLKQGAEGVSQDSCVIYSYCYSLSFITFFQKFVCLSAESICFNICWTEMHNQRALFKEVPAPIIGLKVDFEAPKCC
jgi:hypothetical protein